MAYRCTCSRKVNDITTHSSLFYWVLAFQFAHVYGFVNIRHEDVNKYEERAPNAKLAHPHPDHFHPLHVALGAAGGDAKGELIHNSWSLGTLSYSSYRFKTST